MSGFFTQTNLFLLHLLRFVEIRDDIVAINLLFWVDLSGAVELDEFLNVGVMCVDRISTLLDDAIFGLDLFQ